MQTLYKLLVIATLALLSQAGMQKMGNWAPLFHSGSQKELPMSIPY